MILELTVSLAPALQAAGPSDYDLKATTKHSQLATVMPNSTLGISVKKVVPCQRIKTRSAVHHILV
jgi:hypothetical protein